MTGKNRKIEAAILVVISVISKGLALVREMLFASFYGTSSLLDAYYAGTAFSNFLLFFFSGGTFIPILMAFLAEKKDKKALNGFFVFLLILSVLLSLLTIYFGPSLVDGVRESVRNDALLVVRITSLTSVFYVLSSILRAQLNSIDNYRLSGLQDFVMILVVIIGIFISRNNNSLVILSVTFLASGLFRVLVQLPAYYSQRSKFERKISINWPVIASYSKRLFPLIFVTMVPQLFVLYTKWITSSLPEGALAGLSYAERTSDISKSVIAFSLGAVIINPLTTALKQGKKDKFAGLIKRALEYVFFLSIPLALSFLFFGKEIVSLLYLRGQFGSDSLISVSSALGVYSLAALFSSPVYILANVFYVTENWKGFLTSSLISILAGITVMQLLIKSMGVNAVALGIGFYTFLFYLIAIFRSGVNPKSIINLNNTMKQFAAFIFSFVLAYLSYQRFENILFIFIAPIMSVIALMALNESVFREVYRLLFKKLRV